MCFYEASITCFLAGFNLIVATAEKEATKSDSPFSRIFELEVTLMPTAVSVLFRLKLAGFVLAYSGWFCRCFGG
jgi:hypothetical protein